MKTEKFEIYGKFKNLRKNQTEYVLKSLNLSFSSLDELISDINKNPNLMHDTISTIEMQGSGLINFMCPYFILEEIQIFKKSNSNESNTFVGNLVLKSLEPVEYDLSLV